MFYISELPSQTSTGTIALQVEDLNDNCPKLLNNVRTVCSDTRVVNVTAEDKDSDPNGAPLEFSLIQEKTKGKWSLQRINGNTTQITILFICKGLNDEKKLNKCTLSS